MQCPMSSRSIQDGTVLRCISEKMTFRQRTQGIERMSCTNIWRTVFQEEGTVHEKLTPVAGGEGERSSKMMLERYLGPVRSQKVL